MNITKVRENEIRKQVRNTIRFYVEEELKGDELLTKEIRENLDYSTEKEEGIFKDELRKIIEILK